MKVIGLAGWSGAGKTTLIERVLPVLRRRGLRVSTLKHAHHKFDMDASGKDSWRHREAGAEEVLIASAGRWALLHELREAPEPSLPDLLAKLTPVDLVILEGWRNGRHAKIEVWREANGKPFLYPDDAAIGGLVSDTPDCPAQMPAVHSADIEAVADLLLKCAAPLSSLEDAANQ
ncbi:MAG: molybdopterin-guanine dinucleotide biosynthesis protein B [Hyphomicrobiales bacterium]|nr:molybdopterin-guanine dinucleotide biosynthesis protein B [Hyphomicrobiales bacterium]